MELLTDERAQAIQIGAVLLFGVLIVFLSLYQAFVVPNQNEEVEFNHNEDLQQQLTELRSNVILMPGSSSTRAASLDLGVRYPSRAIFVNPAPPSGTFRTVGTTDAGVNVTIRNASAVADEGETGDFWNGSTRSYNTGSLEYQPGYNLYANAPRTVYEHSVLYNSFDGTDVRQPITEQTLVDGNRITLVAVNGSLLDSRVDTMSVDVRPVSTRTRTVTVDNASGDGPITLELPTGLTADEWADLLADEDRVEDVRPGDRPGVVEIELAAGEYRIELAKVGVGTGVTETDPAYLTDVSGDGRTIQTEETQLVTVEARDPFNRPYRGVTVNASAEGGTFTSSGTDQVTTQTDNEGRITVEYKGVNAGSNDLNFSVAPGYEPEAGTAHAAGTTENVTMTVTVESPPDTGGSGGQVAYNATWQTPTGTGITCTNDSCVVDQNARGGADLPLTMETDPSAADADVEFAVNDTGTAGIASADDTTAPDGTASMTLSPLQNGTVYAYTWSGGSGDRLQVEFVNVSQGPFFDVTIDSVNSTVTEGDDVVVDYTIENTGGVQDTQDIVFEVNGTQEDTEGGVTLAGGETFNGQFTNMTLDGDAPQITTTVNSDNDTASETVTVQEPPFFDVEITSTNSPVAEGDTLTVDVNVTNTGDTTDTQTLNLTDTEFTNTEQDTVPVTLAGGEFDNSITLEWETSDGDAGTGNVTVFSENDSDGREVQVGVSSLSDLQSTDIVPNASEQMQTFNVTIADSDLPSGEKVEINLTEAQATSPITVDYSSASVNHVSDDGQGGDASIDTDTGVTWLNYSASSGTVSAGTTVSIRVESIDAGSESDQSNPYTVRFNRTDTSSEGTTQFRVTPQNGTAELDNLNVTDLVGTGEQEQTIKFTPTTDMVATGDGPEFLTIELSTAQDGNVDYSSASVKSTSTGSAGVNTDAGVASVKFEANGGISAGTDVEIVLESVKPSSAGDTYQAGLSRGTADTAATSFDVLEPPFFEVTIDSANSTVTEGDDVVVEYTIENTGDVTDTQDIVFEVNGTQEATEAGVTLAAGATFSDSFTYTTQDSDAPQITTTVSSDNDSASRTVTVRPSIIDNFEDGNINEYQGDTNQFSVVTSPVFDGNLALRADPIGNAVKTIESTSGLPSYPKEGDTFSFNIRPESFSNQRYVATLGFGETASGNNYEVSISETGKNTDTFELQVDNGVTTRTTGTFSLSSGTWYEVTIEWTSTDVVATFTDTTTGNVIATQSVAADGTNNVDYLAFSNRGGSAVYDYVRRES